MFKLKNWKLSLLALLLFCLFIALGVWQLNRAQQKQALLNAFAQHAQLPPHSIQSLNHLNDQRFYRVLLKGNFDNAHTFLLDNKTFHQQVGYEVYTPFKAAGIEKAILVDRGFIPLGSNRQILPTVPAVLGERTIVGLLNLPPTYFALGSINENAAIRWPLRIGYIVLPELEKLLPYSLATDVLNLDPKDPAAFSIEWQIVIMGPERHQAYAVQWFAFALTLLILFVMLNRQRVK